MPPGAILSLPSPRTDDRRVSCPDDAGRGRERASQPATARRVRAGVRGAPRGTGRDRRDVGGGARCRRGRGPDDAGRVGAGRLASRTAGCSRAGGGDPRRGRRAPPVVAGARPRGRAGAGRCRRDRDRPAGRIGVARARLGPRGSVGLSRPARRRCGGGDHGRRAGARASRPQPRTVADRARRDRRGRARQHDARERRRRRRRGARSRRGGAPGVRLRRRRPAERDGRGGARGARRRGGRSSSGRAPAHRGCGVRRSRRRRTRGQGARARPRCAGHPAVRPAVAAARVPRPAAERAGRSAGAGRARGARDADGRPGWRPHAGGRNGGARARRRRRDRDPRTGRRPARAGGHRRHHRRDAP